MTHARSLAVRRTPLALHSGPEPIFLREIAVVGPGVVGMPIAAPIAVMEDEHDHAGALLAELRSLTDGYVPPEWGCATMRALYHGLAELESAMHVHVHLENNVLFPRALRLEGVNG